MICCQTKPNKNGQEIKSLRNIKTANITWIEISKRENDFLLMIIRYIFK